MGKTALTEVDGMMVTAAVISAVSSVPESPGFFERIAFRMLRRVLFEPRKPRVAGPSRKPKHGVDARKLQKQSRRKNRA